MAPIRRIACATLLWLASVNAHFTLDVPATSGFTEDDEDKAPCGGAKISFADASKVLDFHVGGEAVATNLFHPQTNWLYRATLDQTAGGNWTQLFPIVMQNGLGKFCERAIPAPAEWVGQQGVLSVIANTVDGILFQCATVKFVSGTGTPGSNCVNGSASASITTDSKLSAFVGAGSSSSSNATGTTTTTSGSGSQTSSTSSPSPTKNGAPAIVPGSLVFGGLMGILGFALL